MDFAKVRTIAVVGLSAKQDRDSYQVASYLQAEGYRIIPVNPGQEEIIGERCFVDLLAIPQEVIIDLVDIFRQADAVPAIVEQAIARKIPVVWMQEGVVHEEAALKAREHGIEVVMDKCLKKEHIKAKGDGKVHDVIIIGGGPAGLTAGLYAARGGMSALILEMGAPGGQAAQTDIIENYPGFPQGISGPELMQQFYRQATAFGAEFKTEMVKEVDLQGKIKKVITSKETYETPLVIIASGSSPQELGVPGEKEFRGRGVSYCATCDGAFFKGKKVAVIGGGDSAVEEALFLTRFAVEVVIVHRREQLRAINVLRERAKANNKISFRWNTVVEEINGEQMVRSVKLKDVNTGQIQDEKFDGVFVFVGTVPNSNFLRADQLTFDSRGYIVTNDTLGCSEPGVFAAGDVRSTPLRQVSTAVGDGALAAVGAEKYLAELETTKSYL